MKMIKVWKETTNAFLVVVVKCGSPSSFPSLLAIFFSMWYASAAAKARITISEK